MNDLTVGSPTRLIVAFSIPLLLGTLFQQVYQFTDAAVVGHLVGVDGLAAVGASGSLVFLLLGFSVGATAGLAIPVAEKYGAGDLPAMRRAVAAGVYVSALLTVAVMVLGIMFARDLLLLLRTPMELVSAATGFLAVMFGGSAAMVAFNFLAATIRALGDSRTPLLFLVLSSLLNAGLSVAFVGGLRLGVPGAAVATVVAQGASVLACLVWVRRRIPILHLSRADWRLGLREMWLPARTGLPMGFQSSVIAIGAATLQAAVNGLGAEADAAYAAAGRIDQLAVAPLAAFGVAIVTFVAQNRGAEQWHRIRDGVRSTILLGVGVAVVLGVLLYLFSSQIVSLFVGADEIQVHDMTRTYFHINGVMYILLALVFVVRNAVQGMGRSTVPTIAGVLELVMRALAAFVLVQRFGFVGAAWAAPLAWAGSLCATIPAWVRQRQRLLTKERQAYASCGIA